MSDKADRPKSRAIGSLRGLVPFLKPYRKLVLLAVVALVLTAMLSLILPIAVRRVVDGFSSGTLAQMDAYFAAAILIALALGVGTALRYYFVTRLGERVVADIRKAVYARVISMSPSFYERIMTGEVLSRLTTDTTLILSVIGSSISIALRNALMLFGGVVFMLFTSAKLTGMVLLVVPLVLIPIITLGRKLRVLSREGQERIADSSAKASETLLAAQTVQAYSHEAASRVEFDGLTEASFDAARRRIHTRALMTAIVIFVVFSCVVGVLWIGARDVRSEIMTAGELVQFVIYSVMVAGAVAALSEIWGELQRASGATERLVELLSLEDAIVDPDQPVPYPSPARGQIIFDDVSFSYPSRKSIAALDDVTLSIEPGETVAIVGASGAGKTTVFQLLLRFFDPDAGEIRIDGTPIETMLRSELRRYFALVPQDPVIFATTARENIRFGRPEATNEEVEAAARAAAAHDFLAELPDGYDCYVGERGVMLSGGQKQRIAIARAILRDSPVLLLDEATSALDAESEKAVQEAVESLSRSRTRLIIAHRLATVKKADRIIVMEKGRIVAVGRHEDLVASGGLYARLARLQFTDGLVA
ncbi:ABC transporter transmembrane domain-containing protein [Algicella marina]|uniref:ATP-binding cassette domain-containing protein n=1 Tax=Algicella marina TaxID=2683284 RepID=A0A6P1T0H7_9RHOB|nr:ABC transporter transmembrane domain-containing protein [Algicella marina]QHQ35275.1 ATP-binding cassette domain-containing protein [Algicella marina]